MPGESAIALLLPAVEPIVGRWRARHDASAAAGVPAHITLIYPWRPAPLGPPDERALRDTLAETESWTITFRGVGRFDSLLYLRPDDHGETLALIGRLAAAFPEHRPYRGAHEADLVPHLTIGQAATTASLSSLIAEAAPAVMERLSLEVTVDEVALMEQRDDARWYTRAMLPLGS